MSNQDGAGSLIEARRFKQITSGGLIMAKVEINIDTTKGIEKIEALRVSAERSAAAMGGLKRATEEASEAILQFSKACKNLRHDSFISKATSDRNNTSRR